MSVNFLIYSNPVADPGFPTGAPTSVVSQSITGQIFAENWMKMKEIGPRQGAHIPSTPLDPPL